LTSPQPAPASTFPSGRTTFRIAIGFEYTPPAASVAYAEAISSTETEFDPSPIEATGSSFVRMPMARAVRTTFSGPTSSVRRAYTLLSERKVACAIGVGPV
jgi:hypothetical protein